MAGSRWSDKVPRAASTGRVVAAASFCLAALGAAMFAWMMLTGHGTLVRNSLLLIGVDDAHVEWRPEEEPAHFKRETRSPPVELLEAAELAVGPVAVPEADDFHLILAMARFVGDNPRKGQPVQGNTVEVLARVRGEGRGYCADYTQLMMALGVARGINVREWGFGIDGFGAGHAFNEMYSTRYEKWILIDAFKSFYVEDRETRLPLSVLEFQRELLEGRARLTTRVVRIDAAQFRFRSDDEAIAYYEQGANYFYLVSGNNVFTLDDHPVVRSMESAPRSAELLAAIAAGVHPGIVVIPTDGNSDAIRTLWLIRAGFVATGAAFLMLVLVLLVRGASLLRRAHGRKSPKS